MTARHKFTDRDVRERPELIAEAVRYLRWYQGDFEFLLDAKRFEQVNGSVPIGTARGVLNCMRLDARYALVVPDQPAPNDYVPEPEELPRRRPLRVVRTTEKPRYPFPLKTTWNARLLYSAHQRAVVVHALRLDRPIWYYPESDREKFSTRGGLSGLCATSYPTYLTRLARELPEDKRFCHRCANLIAVSGYDWGPTTPPHFPAHNVY